MKLSPADRDVGPILLAHVDELQDCYTRHAEDQAVHGTVHLVWDVVRERVEYARIEEDTTGVRLLSACLRNRLFQWDFEDVPDETYQQTLTVAPPPT